MRLVTRSMVRIRSQDELIHVDGSARKPIRSDFIIWNGILTQSAPTIAAAYALLEANIAKVRADQIAQSAGCRLETCGRQKCSCHRSRRFILWGNLVAVMPMTRRP